MHLSRLQWVAIALSVIWLIGALIYSHNSDLKSAQSLADFSYRVCQQSVAVQHRGDLSECNTKRAENIQMSMAHSDADALMLALAPLPLFWLAGFCGLYFARALVAGFKTVIPWSTLSRWKRAFVVLCFCIPAFSLAVLCIDEMTRYTTAQVPVIPGETASVLSSGEGAAQLVQASGTWVRTDLTDDTIANPIQTSRIICHKAENRCSEAQAYIVGGLSLMADLVEHDVQTWTSDAIVLRDQELCSETIYTIDLNTKKVTGAGRLTNQDRPYCKNSPFNGKNEWGLILSDGFPVYWSLHQKARPWPLRIFQSFFEN